jgi:TolB-like protein/predicted ATPase/Tfp pilus assembly protein PilF
MEGSVRHAGSVLRIAVQLVDASTGAHLWAETYDRTFSPEAVFELQDDLVPRIVSTVADMNGVLPRSMSESVRNRAPDQLSAYEAVLRSFSYFERVTAEELTDALSCLELAVQKAPAYADAWSLIAALCTQDYGQGFNVHPDSLARGAVAARKAVEAAPSNHLAWFGLAQVLFFQKEFQSFRNAVERTAALNPMDGNSIAFLGEMLTYAGDWERGLELAERAKQLNPHHPGWYWYANFYQAYRQGDYRGALSFAHKVNLPGHWGEHVMFAAAFGQLGEREAADKAVRELLKLRPDFVAKVRSDIEKWWDSEYVERLIDGFRKAGLEIADEKVVSAASPATETRTMAQASFSIAVLPFGNLSPDPDNEFFADGLTEEVIADLSVIRALRVISRTSVMHFKGTSKDLRTIARELDVRYVLEGSVRRAGTSLRVTAQLIDAENDSNLWAEKYSGSIEDVFAIQEEISRKIVNALQLRLTDAEARGITERPIDNAAAYDCYMRARHEVYRFTPEGLDRAQKLVDAGLSLIGENSLLLATRGMVSWYYLNFSIRPEERYLNEAAAYAAMSLEQDPQNYAGIFLRGLVASKRGDIESAIRDLQTAHEQKPGDAMVLNELIRHLSSAGQEQSESARRVFEESLSLDPLHALNWAQGAWRHFSAGRLAEAVEAARRIFHLTDRGNPARVYAGYYLALANVREEAIAVFEEEGAALSDTVYGSVSLFLSRALQHDAQGAVRHVTPQLEQAASWTEYLALFLADGYALIGDHDAALRWLRTAVAQGFINYPYLATRDPFLANVRSDPRFAELMRGVKARWEALSQNLMPIQAQHRVFIHSVIPSPAFEASAEADTPLPEIESGNNKSVERQEKEEALLSPSHRSSVSPTLRHTVGRERERNELRAAFNAAKDGRGLLLCIAGEPGIGKTTLVEDFLADLTTESQCTIARGRCSERLAGTGAYLPLLEALESLLQRDQSLAQTMKQLAPTWYAQVAPLSGDSEESARLLAEVKAASQERIKRELASFLQAVARTQPLVIFFDDLHWADISTIDLLSFLAGKFDSMNLLMVVTYRPSDMLLAKHPFLQIKPDLQARGVCRELVLEFLTEPEIAEYLALEFPDHCFPPEFQKLIHAKTEGSPLFMADLVRYLRDRNVIAIEDSRQDASAPRWALAQTLPDIERELPESVRGMIERKIAQVGEEDRKLLTAASVQGYEFDSAVVAQALNLDADEIEERLEKLERVFAFVKLACEAELPNRTLTLKYHFVHVLYQNALYAGLRATRRATISRDVAQALEACYGARSASVANELALLWEAARDYARAADYFLQAARNAALINAHREAAPLAERGLEALGKLPETRERDERELGLQLALGSSLQSALSWAAPEAGVAFNRARRLCELMGDDPRFFAALVGVWAYHIPQAEFRTVHELCEQMLQLAEQSQNPALLVMAFQCWAKAYYFEGDFVAAQQLGERALALDRREYHEAYLSVYNEDGGTSARREHSFCLWLLGYPDRALALACEAVTLAEQTSHPFSLGAAHYTKSAVLAWIGDWQASQKEIEKVFALAEEYALGDMLKHAIANNALKLANQERTEEAIERAKQAIESLNAQGVKIPRTIYLASMGKLFWTTGRRVEGLAAFAEALALVELTGERFYEAEIWRIKGELLLKAAESNAQAEAESCYHHAIEIARQQRAKAWELRATKALARLWQQQGKTAEAHRILAEVYGWFTEGFDTADLKGAKALLDELSLSLKPQEIRSDKLQFVAVAEPDVVTQSSDKLKFVEPCPSIAVLPFVNISNDPDNEYFCDGLAEELLNALSKIEALRVAARTSAFSFKDKEADIREIGRKLNVTTVLEGSVRKAGNRLRITAQLVNIADGYHLWSERYDREMKDIFELQDEITLTVVDALKMKLLGEEKAAVLKHYTDNTEAYQLYLKGRYHANRFTREGFDRAIEYLNEAIEKDPHYALAYAGIADAYYHAATIHMPPGEAFLEVKAASAKALELDDELAEAHTLFAMFVAHYERKPLEAESGFRRAIELAPNNVLTRQQYGLYLAMLGRFDEGIAELKRAKELDPLSLIISFLLGWTNYFARQPEKAKEEARKALEINEGFWMAHWTMALGYEQTGHYTEALAALERAKALDDSSWIPAVCARVYGRLGKESEAQKILDELTEKSKRQWVAPYLVATAYVSLGRRDQAFDWLQKALEDYDEWIDCLNIDPALDTLRSDPRFEDLVRHIGLPQ